MSYEAENLKKEIHLLTNLIKNHQSCEVPYYQRPGLLHNMPNSHSNSSFKTHFGRTTSFHKAYKPYLPISKNSWLDAKNFASNNYSCRPSVSARQKNASFSANQSMPWKLNKASGCAKKPSDSFKLVKTVNSAKNAELHNSVKPVSVSNGSEQKSCNKLPKATKVSYVSCSDCVIKISEFENGELEISQKKVEPVAKRNKKNSSVLLGSSSAITPSSSSVARNTKRDKLLASTGVDSRDNLCNVEFSKPPVGSESRPAVLHESLSSYLAREAVKNIVETDKQCNISTSQNSDGISKDLQSNSKISKTCYATSSGKHQEKKPPNTNLVFQRGSVSSHSFSKFQNSCPRNAKYSKINVSNIKPSRCSYGQQLLKNKISPKKLNALKFTSKLKYKTNIKNVSEAVKYTYIAKMSPQRALPGKITLSSLKSEGKFVNISSSQQNQQICVKETDHMYHKTHASKLGLSATSSGVGSTMKAKTLHLNSAYKFVNPHNLSTRRMVKNSISSRTSKFCSRKYFRNTANTFNAAASPNLNVDPCRNSVSNCRTSRLKQKFCGVKMSPCRSSSYKLKRPLNRSYSVTPHSLQSAPPLEISSQKTSATSLYKSISDNVTTVKKAKKVRLSQTTYKVVNKHANHVSQVVKMIKTKYRTVNKRSTSNSHLKWLQEQRKLYNGGKLKISSHIHTRKKWNFSYSASVGPLRKQFLLRSKTSSRKHLLGQNKVLKKIGGVTYKVSNTKINKSVTPKAMKNRFTYRSNKKNSIVQGTKLHLATSQKRLKRCGREQRNEILKRKRLGEFTYIRQKEGHRNLARSSQAQNLANRVLHKSIHTIRTAAAKKTLQKNNMFCMFFNRFGRCNKEGICAYIHDPSKIAVCTRFLRGTCKVDNCPFSHQVSPGKMAICVFFLQGHCRNNSCPYRHTIIKPGTALCKAFVRGYCSNGNECKDAHILACPQFICEGVCKEGSSCKWPHPPMKKNIKKNCDVPVSEVHEEIKEKEKIAANDDVSDLRYFTYEHELVSNQSMNDTKIVKSNSQIIEKFPKRNKKIHQQPEFIPLHISDENM